jgi:indole-3-acetate monooxygenase
MTSTERAAALHDRLDAIGADAPPGAPFSRDALDLIASAGLNGLVVPTAVGGSDLPLAEVIETWAELARADGSIGWCAFASDSALAYFGAYLPDAGVDEVFAGVNGPATLPIMAGQFAPNGTGTPTGAGWSVHGDFRFGSGMLHADWAGAGFFTAPEDGGDPAYLMGCFPALLIEPRGNWDVLGLRSTCSIDYGVRGVEIPAERTFDFFAPTVHRGSAKHHLGVIPLTAAGHAAWAIGVSRRMLDELAAVATGTTRMGAPSSLAESEHFCIEFARLESRQRAARAWALESAARAEDECATLGGPPSALTADLLRQACVHANREAVEIARVAYGLAGTAALRDGPLQRCFRDLHAGAQHYFASDLPSVDLARTLLVNGADHG